MADNVIKVSVRPSKQNSVSVSSNIVSTPITANSDTSQLWSQVSKNWAVSDSIVDGVDYSSKFYANKAKTYAENAQSFESSSRDIYNNFLDSSTEAIENIGSVKEDAIINIENSKTEAIVNIANSKTEAVDSINNTKTTILNDIEFVAEGEKKEINDLADEIKDSADTIINRVGWNMFDTVVKDHILTYEESRGLALQGTYVYKTAIAGERYGYSDFYAKVVEEYDEATATETVNGVTVKVHSNGHKFYDIANKSAIDSSFNSLGTAWYYGIDTANERVFLPRDKYFAVNGVAPVVGNGITLGLTNGTNNVGMSCSANGSLVTGEGIYNTPVALVGEALGTRPAGIWGVTTDPTKSGIEAHLTANEDKYLYICVGNTVSDTSWVDVVTQVKGGVKDLEDKKNTSIAEIDANAKSYDNLTKRQITNCLLEVPQNIKLELADGVLTLKAGSIVTVPNGFEADGTTAKFDYILTESDTTIGTIGTATGETFLLWNNATKQLAISFHTSLQSGSSVPSTFSGVFYNTTNNTMAEYQNGVIVKPSLSLPFALYVREAGVPTSINQVFNGFGYIGSHIWMDKGVKVLVANGINDDGTIKNEEIVVPNVLVSRNSLSGTRSDLIPFLRKYPTNNQLQIYIIAKVNFLGELDYVPTVGSGFQWYFNTQVMKWYMHEAGATEWVSAPYYNISPTISVVNNVITSFQPYKPFRAVDYNDAILKTDKQEIVSWCTPDYTAMVSISSGYTAPTAGVINFKYRMNISSSITINGEKFSFGTGASAYTATRYVVDKGDIITFSGADATAIFYPLKGVK